MAIIPSKDLITPVAAVPEEYSSSYTPALVSLAVLYFMMGFITCLNDTLVPFFKRGFTLTYAESSLVQFYFFLTYGIMSIPAGKIVERTGYKKGMVLGFSIAAAGALLFFPASVFHQYGLFLGALFTIAIGIVLLQVAANPYVTILGPARTASSRLTLVQSAGSIGTTIAPLFGAGFILSHLHESHASSEALKIPYLGIALLLLIVAAVVSRLKLPVIQAHSPASAPTSIPPVPGQTALVSPFAKKRGIFSFRNLSFGVPALFAYVGAEVAVGTFLTNYISDILHIPEKEANRYVAFYWGGMLAGRLLGSVLLRLLRPSYVLSCCAVSAITLIAVSIASTGPVAVWSMVAVGLCNAVMFATIFSLAINGVGGYTMKASGLLSTAIVGGAIIPFIQGVIKDHYNWQWAFIMPAICYLYILFYGVNGYRSRNSSFAGNK
jgi:FHS family L-fucose permease-like MFS transporter